MSEPRDYAAEYRDDEPKPRKPYACRDRLCGALDCVTCHPESVNEQEDEE